MKRFILVLAVAAVMAAMVVVTAAPAFAAPWWKDGDRGTNPNETPNCTWGYHTNANHPKVCWASASPT